MPISRRPKSGKPSRRATQPKLTRDFQPPSLEDMDLPSLDNYYPTDDDIETTADSVTETGHVLKATPKEAIRAYKNANGKITLDMMRKLVPVQEDFAALDLNSAAELFLPKSTRTQPSAEEIEAMRREYVRRQESANEQYRETMQKLNEKYPHDSNGIR